jgi:hypothetical protein
MIFLLRFCLTALLFSSGGGERYIEWRADAPLVWDDFKGSAESNTDMLAMTKSKLKYKWGCDEEGNFNFEVIARFDRGTSWKIGNPDKELLAHEQLHFDITELYARKMRELLSNLENPCSLTTEDMKAELSEVQRDWDARQKLYDRETDHSKDKIAQAKWRQMINKEMKTLEAFASE